MLLLNHLMFRYCLQHKQNCINLHCIGVKADMQTDIWKLHGKMLHSNNFFSHNSEFQMSLPAVWCLECNEGACLTDQVDKGNFCDVILCNLPYLSLIIQTPAISIIIYTHTSVLSFKHSLNLRVLAASLLHLHLLPTSASFLSFSRLFEALSLVFFFIFQR